MTATTGQPEYDGRDWTLPYAEQEPTAVRWDLAFGACLSFGPDDNGGPHMVRLSLSDKVLVDRGLHREVTTDQLRTFAFQLLRLLDREHLARGCRTNAHQGIDRTAVALVDGDLRCAFCIEVMSESGPVDQEPLPWADQPSGDLA
ncbi:hypothetical protein ACIBTV_27095 [Micromonospora sp. NPDC049366]|uniref:hypothetical protein n=1 Tax=Micromonospora sp. NPDC049366 TaxID=3364271 RepID=UPI0037909779